MFFLAWGGLLFVKTSKECNYEKQKKKRQKEKEKREEGEGHLCNQGPK